MTTTTILNRFLRDSAKYLGIGLYARCRRAPSKHGSGTAGHHKDGPRKRQLDLRYSRRTKNRPLNGIPAGAR